MAYITTEGYLSKCPRCSGKFTCKVYPCQLELIAKEKKQMTPQQRVIEEKRIKDQRKRLFALEIKYGKKDRDAVVETKDGRRRFVRLEVSPVNVEVINFGQGRTFLKNESENWGDYGVFYEAVSYRVYTLPAGISATDNSKTPEVEVVK